MLDLGLYHAAFCEEHGNLMKLFCDPLAAIKLEFIL